MIRLVLADDHHLVRQGFRALLHDEPDMNVVAEAATGPEAISQVQHHKPDVLLIDLMIPGSSGLDVTRDVKQHSPKVQVVVLSIHNAEPYVAQALLNGATGYVLKSAERVHLLTAIRCAMLGERYLSPPLSESAIEAYLAAMQPTADDSYNTLTSREREILQMVAQGQTNAQIGEWFSISPRTVEVHRAHVMRKLAFTNQAELIRYALQHGLISPES